MSKGQCRLFSIANRYIGLAKTSQDICLGIHIADAARPEQMPASFRYPRAGTANADVKLGIAL